jgi:hypothetical protein
MEERQRLAVVGPGLLSHEEERGCLVAATRDDSSDDDNYKGVDLLRTGPEEACAVRPAASRRLREFLVRRCGAGGDAEEVASDAHFRSRRPSRLAHCGSGQCDRGRGHRRDGGGGAHSNEPFVPLSSHWSCDRDWLIGGGSVNWVYPVI